MTATVIRLIREHLQHYKLDDVNRLCFLMELEDPERRINLLLETLAPKPVA